jgi:O-acetylhomoserine/O-acetylserine sulfhydrylase-like pyridoxal-dependent enzyme
MAEKDHEYGIGTRAIHAGAIPDPVTGARATPIHQTTSFVFDSAEHAASLVNLQTFGNVYSRISNHGGGAGGTRGPLEGGRRLACATGMAAQMTALRAIRRPATTSSRLRRRGGTVGQLGIGFAVGSNQLRRSEDPENFRRAIRPTRAPSTARPGQSAGQRSTSRPWRIAHEHGLPLSSTTRSEPPPVQPRLGADIVVHSATKYPAAGTTMAGVVVNPASSTGAAASREEIPEMLEPSKPTTASSSTRPRRLRLHHEGAHGGEPPSAAPCRPERLADPAGGDPAPAHAGALPQRPRVAQFLSEHPLVSCELPGRTARPTMRWRRSSSAPSMAAPAPRASSPSASAPTTR